MEELQSTEILDREILEDARKKAQRILKAADDAAAAKTAEWEQKSAVMADELAEKYARLREDAGCEIMARLPVDKKRAKAEKIENLLKQAAAAWYAGLSRERVLSLLEGELARRLADCGEFFSAGGQPRVMIHLLEPDEARSILQKAGAGQYGAIEKMHSDSPYPEIILENSAARISASINKTIDFFLHEQRAELTAALLGEDALC
jgi:vacuolar-type H+-ATPase subunit E/Vma4